MATTHPFQAPADSEYDEYYGTYVSLVNAESFADDLRVQPQQLRDALENLTEEECLTLHDPYTWTLKQVVGHLIDCERIFSVRLYRIAAGDQTPQPGFEQNSYVDNLDYQRVSMKALLNEFDHLRQSNILLADRLSPETLARTGTASDCPISARACLYILVGHVEYHLRIVKKRLGI